MPPAERTWAAATDLTNVLLVGAQRWGVVTFICAVHYADAVGWDQKRTLIKHLLNLKKAKGERRQSEGREKRHGKQQRNDLNVIYWSSSRAALNLTGLINSLWGLNKVSHICQGALGPSITI